MTPTASEQDLLLDVVVREQQAARDAEARMLVGVVDFCAAHPPLDGADRSRVKVAESIDGRPTLEPLNGDGVPEVSALAVAQLGATLSMSPGSVQNLVGEGLELAYRLPDLYAQVQTGTVPVWQARRVAKTTIGLTLEAARFVDRHLHGLTGSISIKALDGLVSEAIARHDHARLAARIRKVTDPRRFSVELGQCDLLGQVPVSGVLELPDAIALEAAVAHAAEQLTAWGSTETRDPRRARAVGDLARAHLALSGQPAPTGRVVYDDQNGTFTPVPLDDCGAASGLPGQPGAELRKGARREAILHLHITDRELIEALRSRAPDGTARGRPLLGRAEHASTGDLPITAEIIRNWCGAVNTRIRVLPVLDISGRVHHDAYEIPERLREQIIGRDHTCVFPGCHAPARACDIDHIIAFDHDHPERGGPTATENLACLCRKHHNLKTTGRIRYWMTAPGAFAWDLGTGETFIRDHRGARIVPPRAAEP